MKSRILSGLAILALVAFAGNRAFAQNAYITNQQNYVSVINTATNTVTATIPIADDPFGVAVSPNGSQVYVGSRASPFFISVIDAATNVVNSIPLFDVDSPMGVAVSPDGSRVYATSSLGTVLVIDASTNSVINAIPVGTQPFGVAVSPDGKTVYVADFICNDVAVVDTASGAVTTYVSVGEGPGGVAISPNAKDVYVTDGFANEVTVIDTASDTTIAAIPVGSIPVGVAVSADSKTVYVTNVAGNTLSVIDGASNTVTATIPVGNGPYGVAIAPSGNSLYVANGGDGTVSVVDTTTNTVSASISVGGSPSAFGIFIQPPPPAGAGFTITPIPANEAANNQAARKFILRLKSLNGFTGDVTLSCSGGPPGASCTPSSRTVHIRDRAQAVSRIHFPKDMAPGAYSITFTGTSGAVTRMANGDFTIE